MLTHAIRFAHTRAVIVVVSVVARRWCRHWSPGRHGLAGRCSSCPYCFSLICSLCQFPKCWHLSSLSLSLSLPLSLSHVMDETGVVIRTRELKNKERINTTNSDLLVSFSFFLSFLLVVRVIIRSSSLICVFLQCSKISMHAHCCVQSLSKIRENQSSRHALSIASSETELNVHSQFETSLAV
jgi:hypothetical protein